VNAAHPRPHAARLGRELRRLRELAGLSQRQVGEALAVSQATINRIETADAKAKPLSWPKVQQWATACKVANPDLSELREMVEFALDERTLYRNLLEGGLAEVQEEIRTEEAAARMLRHFNPSFVPGLLQTPEYARRVLLLADYRRRGGVDEAVGVRMRRQEILRDEKHLFEFVLTENGLRWRPGPVEVVAEQAAHIADMAAMPNITVSVIPANVIAHALPTSPFVMYEDHADGRDPWVAVELTHKRVIADKAEDVDIYRAHYDLLLRSALQGEEAMAFAREVGESLS
jgi:transcriptional regulator with XRE-family HTH domain